MLSNDSDEEHLMHWKSDNLEIKIHDDANQVVKDLFESIPSRYQ